MSEEGLVILRWVFMVDLSVRGNRARIRYYLQYLQKTLAMSRQTRIVTAHPSKNK